MGLLLRRLLRCGVWLSFLAAASAIQATPAVQAAPAVKAASAVEATPPVVCGPKPISVAFYEFGYFYYVENGKAQGIDKDIVDELERRSGCAFARSLMVRARIWANLASGDLDMSVSGIQNPQRDTFAWFAHYLTMKNHAILRADIVPIVRNAGDFLAQPMRQFGVVRAFQHGADQERWLAILRAAGRVQESPDVETIFKKLRERRVDAMFSQPPVYRKKIADLGLQHLVHVQDWTPTEQGVPHGLILAKSRFGEENARQWRALIDAMRADGTLQRIYSRYLPVEEAKQLLAF
ncbi:substrate-binding periplasmic protein [Candidatus Symbiobacter mobilis]|uniref:Solute-binding protein family 3/N-terminal domain-containing protein n=1 Tax=Candidatus Symbiobacter mobilis CR TaxID=946483 RepID=U5NCM5_9BURK|nr:transporter substrate-binding domain-containing protein [Candidatus Symbiobacter mobilis]AGX87978.1 hypothetical protein Cenrod_1900 [Candidatus Symbiobacter mobilis CR]